MRQDYRIYANGQEFVIDYPSLAEARRARAEFALFWPNVYYVLVATTYAAERAYFAFLDRIERRDRRGGCAEWPGRLRWPSWRRQRGWRLKHNRRARAWAERYYRAAQPART